MSPKVQAVVAAWDKWRFANPTTRAPLKAEYDRLREELTSWEWAEFDSARAAAKRFGRP